MNLFPNLAPKTGRLPAGIDLRCCGVEDVLAEVRGARLVIADPPWQYSQRAGAANPEKEGIYQGLPVSEIAKHLASARACVDRQGGRLAMWCTWPLLGAWVSETHAWEWGNIKTGGSWHKDGPGGVGFHWLGASEIVLLYVSGSPGCQWGALKNAHNSIRQEHSVKPIDWMRGWIDRWTEPGDLVLDLYAGLGSVAVACALEGRRYVGAEIDAERHRRAVLNVERAALGGGA